MEFHRILDYNMPIQLAVTFQVASKFFKENVLRAGFLIQNISHATQRAFVCHATPLFINI